jgi:hypothetical protein
MKVMNVNGALDNPNGITKNSYERYILRLHCNFFQILICYANLIVPQFDIKLVEVFCPIQSIQHIINAKHMIVNIYIYFIQGTIINTYSQLAILFINKQNMYPISTLLNIPPIEEVI